MSYEGPGTILGGLPVIAIVHSGKDADTPNGPGEYWSEVLAIHWSKRDGSKGKELPEHIVARAEKYDYAFCDLIEAVHEHLAYEKWAQENPRDSDRHPNGPRPQAVSGSGATRARAAGIVEPLPHPIDEDRP